MQKSETITNLIKSILSVMSEVKGIEKSMVVGTGNYSYNGVPDHQVKKIIGESMVKNGLIIIPTGINPKLTVERWEEVDTYSKTGAMKSKQSVFVETSTSYILAHESGEFIEVSGYGHGVDSQDKAAGKATTYALKYLLLYLFLVPTGKIDDADAFHSDEKEAPPVKKTYPKDDKPWLNEGTKEFEGAIKKLMEGTTTIEKIKTVMKISKSTEEKLINEALKKS